MGEVDTGEVAAGEVATGEVADTFAAEGAVERPPGSLAVGG